MEKLLTVGVRAMRDLGLAVMTGKAGKQERVLLGMAMVGVLTIAALAYLTIADGRLEGAAAIARSIALALTGLVSVLFLLAAGALWRRSPPAVAAIERRFLVPTIWVTLNKTAASRSTTELPAGTETILSAAAQYLFFKEAQAEPTHCTWDDFMRRLEPEQKIWVPDFLEAAKMTIENDRMHTDVMPLFKPHPTATIACRPFLARKDIIDKTSVRLTVAFVEIPAPWDLTSQDESDKLFHLLAVTKLFRWRVVQIFGPHFKMESTLSNDKKIEEMQKILNTIHKVVHESHLGGLFNPEQVIKLFEGYPKQQGQIRAAIIEWHQAITALKTAAQGTDQGYEDRIELFAKGMTIADRVNWTILGCVLHRLSKAWPMDNALDPMDDEAFQRQLRKIIHAPASS